VLELDQLPAGHSDEIAAAAPAAELVDGGALFAACRRMIDDTERKLIEHADRLACTALEQIDPMRANAAGEIAGLVEQHARLGAAEEAYIAVAPDLDADRRLIQVSKPLMLANRFAVRASVAYKGAWVRRTRTFARDAVGGASIARADAWLAQVARSLVGGKPLAAQLAPPPGAEIKSFMAESCIGSYPLEAVASSRTPGKEPLAAGTYLVLTVELAIDGAPWLGAVPAFVGAAR
jgi:hypothetical protein